MKKGDRIRIIHVDDNHGQDWQASLMNGIEGVVELVDSFGQVHVKGLGIALIPEVDEFQIIEKQ